MMVSVQTGPARKRGGSRSPVKQPSYSTLSRLLTQGPSHLEGLKLSPSCSLTLYLLSFLDVQFSSLSPSGSDLRNPTDKHCYTVVEEVSGPTLGEVWRMLVPGLKKR